MKARKAIRIGLLCLLLGLGTTYLVAWSFMNFRSPTFLQVGMLLVTSGNQVDQTDWMGMEESKTGIVWVQSNGLPLVSDLGGKHPGNGARAGRPRAAPDWSITGRKAPSELFEGNGMGMLFERAAGWPRLAVVEREVEADWWTSGPRQIGSSIRAPGNGGPWTGVALAFTPLQTGFAIDATFYTALWAGALICIAHLRRSRRLRAGQCPICRYDLTGITTTTCPECGTPIAPATTLSSSP